MHEFDKAIRLEPLGDNRYRGHTAAPYGNMVGPFGGITAAQLMNAVLMHTECDGEVMAMTVNFAGPVAEGEFEIEAVAERINRSSRHFSVKQIQGRDVLTTASLVLANRRDGWSAVEKSPPGLEGRPADFPTLGLPGAPGFTKRYDMRFVEGQLTREDMGPRASSGSRLWMRDEPPRPLTITSLAALCDAFLPRVFLRLGKPVPIGTVTMTTYFHGNRDEIAMQSDRHVYGVARGENFRNRFYEQSAEVWSDSGTLLATSQQLTYYRA